MADIPLPTLNSTLPGGGFTSVLDAMLKGQAQAQKNQYYPAATQADIDYKNAQTSRAPFENALAQAQTQMQQARNPYEAAFIQSQIAQQNANASRAQYENALNEATKNQINAGLPFIAALNNSKIAANLAKANGTASSRNATPLMKSINDYQSYLVRMYPELATNPAKVVAITEAAYNGQNTLPNGEALPDTGDVGKTLLGNITRNSYSNPTLTAQRFASTLDGLIKQITPLMDASAVYAGPTGKLKFYTDKYNAEFLHNTSPEYKAYNALVKVLSTGASAEALKTAGGNFTEGQSKKYASLFNEDALAGNPELVRQNIDQLKSMYGAIGKSLTQTPNEIRQQLRNGPSVPAIGGPPPMPANLQNKGVVRKYNPVTGGIE